MTIKAGVIGHPVAHSKSPLIHGYWIKKHGLDGEYNRHDINPARLKEGVQQLIDKGLSGFNVTIPHKQTIMPLCATISPTAEQIGAVNLVTIDADGKLHGENTDAAGFIYNLLDHVPDLDFTRLSVLVIGAGGAARAVVTGLHDKGAKEILVCNRTPERAAELAGLCGGEVIPWEDRHEGVAKSGLIVNTSSLGMTGQPALDLDLSTALKGAIIYDLVYDPLETNLLKQAREHGLRPIGGIGMLLHQARPAFKAWFGVMPEISEELEALVTSPKAG